MTSRMARKTNVLKKHNLEAYFIKREKAISISSKEIQTARASIGIKVAETEAMLNESMRLAGSIYLS